MQTVRNLQCQKHVGVIQLRQIALDSMGFAGYFESH